MKKLRMMCSKIRKDRLRDKYVNGDIGVAQINHKMIKNLLSEQRV